MPWREPLHIQPGVTAVTGSGGKTTLLELLGRELAERGRVLLCTTTRIYPFPGIPCARSMEELEALTPRCPLLSAGRPAGNTGKLGPLDVPLSRLMERFDYILVEADGAAGHPLKAHEAWEPVIPLEAAGVIQVMGGSGFGKPIRQAVHRPERYALLAGTAETEIVTAEIQAAVLMKENLPGLLFLNQAETAEILEAGRRLAGLLGRPLLAGSFWRGECVECW